MIKEVIIVEGKMDIVAINKAVEADCLITDGFRLRNRTIKNIRAAYDKRGIIILTDPDSAGENIRTKLTQLFPHAKHAFIPQDEATNMADGDIGIEQATPEAIREALSKVRTQELQPSGLFSVADMMRHQLMGATMSSVRRARLGRILGLGYANAKTFLKRLNTYGVTRAEFEQAIAELAPEHIAGEKELRL